MASLYFSLVHFGGSIKHVVRQWSVKEEKWCLSPNSVIESFFLRSDLRDMTYALMYASSKWDLQ